MVRFSWHDHSVKSATASQLLSRWVSVIPMKLAQPRASVQLSLTQISITLFRRATRFWYFLMTTTPTSLVNLTRSHAPLFHHLSCHHHHQRTFCSVVGVTTSMT